LRWFNLHSVCFYLPLILVCLNSSTARFNSFNLNTFNQPISRTLGLNNQSNTLILVIYLKSPPYLFPLFIFIFFLLISLPYHCSHSILRYFHLLLLKTRHQSSLWKVLNVVLRVLSDALSLYARIFTSKFNLVTFF